MIAEAKPRSHPCLMIADLLEQLVGIAPDRVRLYPSPGTAVYTGQNDPVILTQDRMLDGGEVLRDFSVLIKSLLDEVDQQLGAEPPIPNE